MERLINFGAGPAKFPEEVLKQAQKEFFVLPGIGLSIVEMSHRSPDFKNMYNQTVKLLREEMSIPNEFEVLFMHGGATAQFAAIPMNLKGERDSADYAITGKWSLTAAKEGSKFIDVKEVFKPLEQFDGIPDYSEWQRNREAAYLYYCANETVDGVEFQGTPETFSDIPLVADVSSNILSRPFSFIDHGIVFGSVQKNLGAAGLAVAIVRKDLIKIEHNAPSVLSYHEMAKTASNYNTPNVFGIYVTKLILEWIRNQGGIEEIAHRNQIKAKLIYDVIDSCSPFYYSSVKRQFRSFTNVTFRIGGTNGNEDLEKKFLAGALERGMIGLEGHRTIGGIRASLYNAMTLEETQILHNYMEEFHQKESAKN